MNKEQTRSIYYSIKINKRSYNYDDYRQKKNKNYTRLYIDSIIYFHISGGKSERKHK